MISAATVSTTATSWSTSSTPFLEALWGTPSANQDTRGYLGALVFWLFIFAQYIAAIILFVSAFRDRKKNQADIPEQQA